MKIYILISFLCIVQSKRFKEEERPKWARKDIRDYNDADLERLLDQWEVSYNNANFLRVFFHT